MNNWVVIIYTAMALIVSACHKAEATSEVIEEQKPAHECKCVTKLVGPVWKFGTLCAKDEVSQGHGVNPKGQVVSGCYKLEHSCPECDGE